jgi:hypothetical protein
MAYKQDNPKAETAGRSNAVHFAKNRASQGINFIPLALETLGRGSTQEVKILSLRADHIEDRKGLQRATCRSALFRGLSIATRRSIARDIIERSGRLPAYVSENLQRLMFGAKHVATWNDFIGLCWLLRC